MHQVLESAQQAQKLQFFSSPLPTFKQNKFVQTKMRLKLGTKIELQRDLSDLKVLDLSDLSISAI